MFIAGIQNEEALQFVLVFLYYSYSVMWCVLRVCACVC